jgi:hypothetical protein
MSSRLAAIQYICSALVYELKCGGMGVAGSQPTYITEHMEPK